MATFAELLYVNFIFVWFSWNITKCSNMQQTSNFYYFFVIIIIIPKYNRIINP